MSRDMSLVGTVKRQFIKIVKHSHFDLFLIAVFGGTLATIVALDYGLRWGVRPMIAMLAVLIFPGYILIAILYPRKNKSGGFNPNNPERAALVFGTSVVLAPLLALVPGLLNLTYTPITLLIVVEATLVVGIPIVVYRRRDIPRSNQYQLPVYEWLRDTSHWLSATNWYRRVTRGLVATSVLLAVLSFGYVLAVPQDGEQYSTMSLLSDNEADNLVMTGYPRDMTAGDASQLTLMITNDRSQRTTYSVVVRLERVSDSNGTQRIIEAEQLTRLNPTIESGENWSTQHTVTPTMTGDELRLRYYLYVGSPPDVIGPKTARDHLHLWVNVSET